VYFSNRWFFEGGRLASFGSRLGVVPARWHSGLSDYIIKNEKIPNFDIEGEVDRAHPSFFFGGNIRFWVLFAHLIHALHNFYFKISPLLSNNVYFALCTGIDLHFKSRAIMLLGGIRLEFFNFEWWIRSKNLRTRGRCGQLRLHIIQSLRLFHQKKTSKRGFLATQ